MKHLNEYIIEKFKINKNTKVGIINKVDISKLKFFSKEDVDKIIDWIDNDMSEDIKPVVITNVVQSVDWYDSAVEIYLYYTKDYNKSNGYNLPYIRFFYDNINGLSIDIYDDKDTKYYRSSKFDSTKDLDKCFEYIESKKDIIKNFI